MDEKLLSELITLLKPDASPLGFRSEELEQVVRIFASELQEGSSLEDKQKLINDRILPTLRTMQSAVTRIVNATKPTADKSEGKEKTSQVDQTNKAKEVKEEKRGDKVQTEDRLADLFAQLNERLDRIESSSRNKSRKEKVSEAIKGLSEKKREMKLRDFGYMRFETEEDFNAYLDNLNKDVAYLVQEESNSSLSKMKQPAFGNGKVEEKLTDDKIEKIFGQKPN